MLVLATSEVLSRFHTRLKWHSGKHERELCLEMTFRLDYQSCTLKCNHYMDHYRDIKNFAIVSVHIFLFR